ncbi:MAG: hypothetical protein FOGNACKC_05874 [Anaerolineae bacterium]|nr:hypothetical protein [Anaerolineae bacterium]
MDLFARYFARTSRRSGSLLNLYAWFFMRLSGIILLLLALFHLVYMHFMVPGGVTGINYATIAARWADPAWGPMWRTFDLLLLLFGLTHGANGLRQVLDDHLIDFQWRIVVKTMLLVGYLGLVGLGAAIIFSV